MISEALASGLPVIATHESGATTMVSDGVEGLIIPARQPQAILQAMEKLAVNRSLCEKMGVAGHAKSSQSNSWQNYGDRLLAEYQRRLQTQPTMLAS